MTFLSGLPLETLEIIGSYLRPEEYHKLRVSFKSGLPKKQLMFPMQWLKIAKEYKELPAEFITFYSDLVTEEVWKYCELNWVKTELEVTIDILLKTKPSWFVDRYAKTALGYMYHHYRADGLKKWLSYGFDPSIDNNAAFIHACEGGYVDIVKELLLDPRVDPATKDNYAIKYCLHWEVAQVLLNDPRVDPTADDNCALMFAIENDNSRLVRCLISDPRVDPSTNDDQAIRYATEEERYFSVRCLLMDSRVNPAAQDNFPIRCASEFGASDVVELLLKDPRVDPSARENFAIRKASQNGHSSVVYLLLQHPRVDPTANDNYSISIASVRGNFNVVRVLLLYSRIPRTLNLSLPLMIASMSGHEDVVRLLVSKTVFTANDYLKAIIEATESGHTDIAEFLRDDARRIGVKLVSFK